MDACESDEGEIGSVKHQLDTHEHHNRIPANHDADGANNEECRREVDVIGDIHLLHLIFRSISLRQLIKGVLALIDHIATSLQRLRDREIGSGSIRQ